MRGVRPERNAREWDEVGARGYSVSHDEERAVAWFSCGAASAIAAKLMLEKYSGRCPTFVVYCDTSANEHPDNRRFLKDVERWLGHPITIVRSEKYRTCEEVWEARRYMSGIQGAPCTVELKKLPRRAFERPDDIDVFGLTADEQDRIRRFEETNLELKLDWILRDQGVTKQDCLRMIAEAEIELPVMYRLGYKNNNCIGCVKATSARYWNMIRRDFPEIFQARAEQSRRLGVRLTRVQNRRVFLDELPVDYLPAEPLEDISCGPECAVDEATRGRS